MAISVFDIFKIGIGPSSSHTVGPMRAARLFVHGLANDHLLAAVARIRCELYGSLGLTGRGHGSDKAVMLGLMGQAPESVDVEAIPEMLARVRQEHVLRLPDGRDLPFDESVDLLLHRKETLPFHTNAMRLLASTKFH